MKATRRMDRLCTTTGPSTRQELAEAQASVALVRQLLDVGVTMSGIRSQIHAQRWQRLSPDLVVMHNGPLTELQQWWAATLSVGPLAGRTALQAWGLDGWPTPWVEVVMCKGDRPVLPSGISVRVHESRRVSESDLHPVRRPALLTVERSAIDAAAWTASPRAACGLLAAVVQQRLSVAPRLCTALSEAGHVRHAKLMRVVLRDIDGGAEAMSEVDLGRVCRKFGLDLERQLVRMDAQGRRRYIDAQVRGPGGSVLVEIDGALHLVSLTYWSDMWRGNELVIARERVLRFPSIALHLDEAEVGNQLRRACGLAPLPLAFAA